MKTDQSLRWYGVITLFLIVAISFVDRINIAVLITDGHFLLHYGLAPTARAEQGLLATAFTIGYGLSAFLLTPFSETLIGVRRGLMLGLLLWGGVTFATPWIDSYGTLLASRILLGVAEGPVFSIASTYIKAHFNDTENGKPNSFVNMGTGLGLAAGFPLVGMLLASYSWQTSFHVIGVLNLVLGLPLVLAFIHLPSNTVMPALPKSAGEALSRVTSVMRGALHTRHLLLLTVLTAAFLTYLWGSTNWLPAYLKDVRGFSIRQTGWLSSLPQYATVLAVFIGGVLIDRIGHARVPFIFLSASLGVALSVLLAINVNDPYQAVFCLIAANFFWGLLSPAIPSTVQHHARPEHAGSAFGVVNGIGILVGGFMPTLMGGVMSKAATGGSAAAGFLAGFSLLIGAQAIVFVCGLLLLLRERRAGDQPAIS
jgi:MFS family permease